MRRVWAIPLGLFFFLLNNLAIWSGWLYSPPGYVPSFLLRNPDTAQYFTFLATATDQIVLPDFMLPWKAGDVFFSPMWVIVARVSKLVNVDVLIGYHVFHLLLYIFAAWALLYLLDTFLPDRRQKIAFAIALFCSAPILLIGIGIAPILPIRPEIFWIGMIQFAYETADGLTRGGISNTLTLSIGTGTSLLALAFLGRRIATGNQRYSWMLAGATFVSAFFHPFEVFLIAPASAITLLALAWKAGRWSSALPECAAIAIAAGAGIAPYVYLSLQNPLLGDMRAVLTWAPSSWVWIGGVYGLPFILVAYFLLMRFRLGANTDIALLVWAFCSITIVFIPFIPFALHLFNGFAYVICILLVRIVFQSPQLQSLWNRKRGVVTGIIAVWCLLCLLGYGNLYRQIFRDGHTVNGNILLNAVVSSDELQMMAWMRNSISRDDLVLSPSEQAPWFATVPMHSFGSHDYLSMSYPDQVTFADAFYKGSLPMPKVEETLNDFGVSWVVVPASSAAGSYFKNQAPAFTTSSLRLYQRPGHQMKPYPGLQTVRPDLAAKRSLAHLFGN
jgi:hypothetical protein